MWEVCPIKVGEAIPSSLLLNREGDTLDLAEVVKDKKVVVVFFRGAWCPYCTSHLKALQKVKSEIDQKGYEMIAITVDNVQNSAKVVRKKKLDYQLYSDVGAETIDNFGISFQLQKRPSKSIKSPI